jgi:hypothetical protein
VPLDYHDLLPACDDKPGVKDWFEANYNTTQYAGDPVAEVERWLRVALQS